MVKSYEEIVFELDNLQLDKYRKGIESYIRHWCPKHKLKFTKGRPLFMEYVCTLCGASFIEPRKKFVERFSHGENSRTHRGIRSHYHPTPQKVFLGIAP